MVPLRIFLADDHEIVRFGLRNLLESQFGWNVVGEAADGREAVDQVFLLEPDLSRHRGSLRHGRMLFPSARRRNGQRDIQNN